MQHPICSFLLAGAAAVLACAPAYSQTAAPAPTAAAVPAPAITPRDNPVSSRPEPSIQRIRTEDAGSRIDEVRVGGETQSITVQPKANVPAYEVLPADGTKGGGTAPSTSGAGSSGKRVWNVLKF
ncbi:MAG: hypothetical protein Q8M51_16300 [Polaromonas sp.]|uniref:hypothetical protein n=1 Tax=Polaromonas sp. TaxID=1869339 RepID=UPI0027315459|nr:hypothetical protein [Polaromonas sp.]MDP1740329.1 hypothetical protein [Polaromonas sp.]MDP1955455.1 hypothetical protein [Polaromonas sp.]MDP3357409.1 hypothetical protein [Polaromonas sp.]MDP3753203.1 hypothetical protein [Polaromonas sp.]